MNASTELPVKTALQRGQILHFHARRGGLLLALRGTVGVTSAPQTVSEHELAVQQQLRDGHAHCIAEGGWIRVEARETARILYIAPAGRRTRLQRWLRSAGVWLARLCHINHTPAKPRSRA